MTEFMSYCLLSCSNQSRFHSAQLLNVLACLLQVNHASDVWVMGKAEPESYDAIVTNQSGVVLAAPGADCIPVLFADPVSMVIGAAHAGRCFIHLLSENRRACVLT